MKACVKLKLAQLIGQQASQIRTVLLSESIWTSTGKIHFLSNFICVCVCSYFDWIKYKQNMFTGVLFQESPSEIGGGGLLSGRWVFLWVVLILFCGLSVCLLLCLFLVAWYFCGYLWCCFVRLCLQGQYCSSYI